MVTEKEPQNSTNSFWTMFSVDSLETEGFRDADGYLVLPCDGCENEDWDEL